jgi:hypothetical protein
MDTVLSNWSDSGADEDKPSAVESAVAVTESMDDNDQMYVSVS